MNIVFSFVAHAAIITTAFMVGRGWTSSVPADLLRVSLVSGLAEIQSMNAPKGKKQTPYSPVSPRRNAAVSGSYDHGAAVRDEVPAEKGRNENHIASPAGEDKAGKGGQKESVGAQIGQSWPVLSRGVSSSSPSGGHQALSEGNAPSGAPGYDQAKTLAKGANTEDGRAIHKAIEKALVYPLFAKKRRWEGTAVTEFAVNARGYPEDIRITGSSGYDILDTAAKDALVKAAPFAVEKSRYEIPITFRLKDK